MNAFLLNLLFIIESRKKKKCLVSKKYLSSITDFNVDNNKKCFLSIKSAY